MPFTKLVDAHRCPLPKRRDDGSALVGGDEWVCDVMLADGSNKPCGKLYRRCDSQFDGPYWGEIR